MLRNSLLKLNRPISGEHQPTRQVLGIPSPVSLFNTLTIE